ncbi:MAG: GNAT family N-acetyltransferase [Coriobacteriales bacterium]|jgi:ribosomal protein S18 acetylase RimI-like enzyme|nr:GNAT family N-acetyltransferase [Coriobacteriales bacterium]
MTFELREVDDSLRPQCLEIFNEIIAEGETIPWEVPFTQANFDAYYVPEEPLWCAVAGNTVLGFVHIKPNGLGRTGHLANCGYSVARAARGKGVGKALVAKSIEVARAMGYTGIQFNAVVATNTVAIGLYRSFGFKIIGTVPNSFRFGSPEDPHYVDRHIMYREL